MCSSEVQGLLTFRRSCKRRDGLNDDDRNDVYDNIPEEVLQLGLGSGGRDARNLTETYKYESWLHNKVTNVYGVRHGGWGERSLKTNWT